MLIRKLVSQSYFDWCQLMDYGPVMYVLGASSVLRNLATYLSGARKSGAKSQMSILKPETMNNRRLDHQAWTQTK